MTQEFSDSVKNAAYRLAGGQCECVRFGHGHQSRCEVYFSDCHDSICHFHRIDSDGPATLKNCEVLCSICHVQIRTWGN